MTERVCPECGCAHVEDEGGDVHICPECFHEWLDPLPHGKFVLMDGFAHEQRIIEGDGQYEFVKNALDDVFIGVVTRFIDGEEYDFWHDDEFLCKDTPRDAIACAGPGEVLLGKVLIARRAGGFTVPLTDDDVRRIQKNTFIVELLNGMKVQAVLYEFRS